MFHRVLSLVLIAVVAFGVGVLAHKNCPEVRKFVGAGCAHDCTVAPSVCKHANGCCHCCHCCCKQCCCKDCKCCDACPGKCCDKAGCCDKDCKVGDKK